MEQFVFAIFLMKLNKDVKIEYDPVKRQGLGFLSSPVEFGTPCLTTSCLVVRQMVYCHSDAIYCDAEK